MLRGQKTLEECLQAYSDYASELKPALQIGLLTMRLKSPAMPAESVAALENRLRAQTSPAQARQPQPRNIFRLPLGISRLAAAIAVIFILALGSGAGLVAASADDLPGDSLYGVKRLWESIVLAFAPITGQPSDLWLHIANTRLDEASALADQGRLTKESLVDLYKATYHVSHYDYRSSDTSAVIAYFSRAYLAFTNRIKPPQGAEALYQDVVDAVAPSRVQNGVVTPLTSELPPSLPGGIPVSIPSPTPTNTFVPTDTPSPTLTLTETPTVTPSLTPTLTPTSRIPATATRTPTLTPSPTYTPTYTPSATLTWTPLPLPQFPPVSTAQPPAPTGVVPPTVPVILPTMDATERVRATQQSVYLTQTAGPPP
jgi:hypothetical protein